MNICFKRTTVAINALKLIQTQRLQLNNIMGFFAPVAAITPTVNKSVPLTDKTTLSRSFSSPSKGRTEGENETVSSSSEKQEQTIPQSKIIMEEQAITVNEEYITDLKNRLDKSWTAGLQGVVKNPVNYIPRTEVVSIVTQAINILKTEPNIVRVNFPIQSASYENLTDNQRIGKTTENDKQESNEYTTDNDEEETLLEEDSSKPGITVVGDTHGQFYDVLYMLSKNGEPTKENVYIFNGDFVDRGSFSLQVILLLLSYKILLPESFFLTRGNHETVDMNVQYGFFHEVIAKYDVEVMKLFWELFDLLPLAAIIDGKTLVLHGGLFTKEDVTLEEIDKVNRKTGMKNKKSNQLMHDMLWSDPMKQNGRAMNHARQGGLMFGPDVTKKFLEANGLTLLIRSHQVRKNGFSIEHDGKLITVFSAPNYCDSMNNKGAYIRFNKPGSAPVIKTFSAAVHPPIGPMAHMYMYRNSAKL